MQTERQREAAEFRAWRLAEKHERVTRENDLTLSVSVFA
jgi:hypothetical protein